ncbi:MAG: hypothetical protein K8T20_01360 [Planctomycetes bacterium]|nr:hypothetical protein [Planctomycetota bacterium]
MRTLSFVVCVAAALCALAEPPPDPKTEWPKKWSALAKSAAKEHAAIGKWATGKKLHNEAFPEYVRAAELDPENADAEKGLGRKLEGAAWVADPKTPPKKSSEAPGADVPGILEEIAKKRAACAAKLAKDFTVLAEWAQKNGLKDEAIGVWQQVLDRYDTTSDKAHAGLGHVKDNGVWVPPADLAKREAGAKKIANAPKGEPMKERSEVESALGVSHAKRKSAHFFIEGPWTDAQIAELVQVAEVSRDMFLEMFDQGPDQFANPIHATVLKEQEVYQRYVKSDPRIPEKDKKAYASASGYPVLSPLEFVGWSGDREWDYVRDFVAHMALHVLFCQYFNVFPYPSWLYEGISYWVTDQLLHTAKNFCSGFSTSAGGARDFEDMRAWKAEVKRLERERQDPDLTELFASDLSGMNMRRSMKAWSVVEWLMDERKKDFIAFVGALQGGSTPDEAAAKVFGVTTLGELDVLWEKHVREKY